MLAVRLALAWLLKGSARLSKRVRLAWCIWWRVGATCLAARSVQGTQLLDYILHWNGTESKEARPLTAVLLPPFLKEFRFAEILPFRYTLTADCSLSSSAVLLLHPRRAALLIVGLLHVVALRLDCRI